MTSDTSPREVFLQLVNGVAAGRWAELPALYAERTHVTHPFHPLRPAPLLTRGELRAHFTPTEPGSQSNRSTAPAAVETGGPAPRLPRTVVDVVVHETTDPEVIVAEFAYEGVNPATGEAFRQPGIFVLRVRDGQIVESRDYFDHLTTARVRGDLDALVTAIKATAESPARAETR